MSDVLQLPTALLPPGTVIPHRVSSAAAEAAEWQLACLAWHPDPASGPWRLGAADLSLWPLGIELYGVSLVLTAGGNIRAMAPHVHKRGPAAFRFTTDARWHAFSRAVVAAVQRFDPRALPSDDPTLETRCAPMLAAATMEN